MIYPVAGDESLYPALAVCGISRKRQFLGGGVETASFLFGDSHAEGGERFGLGLRCGMRFRISSVHWNNADCWRAERHPSGLRYSNHGATAASQPFLKLLSKSVV